MAAFAEGLALGEGLGSPAKCYSIHCSIRLRRAVSEIKTRQDRRGNYEAEFPLRWMQKDMHLATVSAYESGVAIP